MSKQDESNFSNGLQVIPPQSVSEIKEGVAAIQKVMKSVMIKDIHYGTVPGCGDKFILLKSGAEKIMATFRIAPKFQIVDLSTNDECRYRIIATALYAPNGNFLGEGVGECSSSEEKFKWRASVCDEEFEDTPESRRRVKWKKGYNGKPSFSVKQIREEHTDKANTVLKIAKKRACIDMVLTVTAASDIFSQDMEDENPKGNKVEYNLKSNGNEEKFHCSECKMEIKKEVYDYSVKVLKKALCFNHQKEMKDG